MPDTVSPVLTARGRYGFAIKTGDPAKIADAQRDLAAAKIEQYVARVLASAPPLTAETADRIAAILRGAH